MNLLNFDWTRSAPHRDPNVWMGISLTGFPSVDANLSPLSTTVASTCWHRLWLGRSILRTDLLSDRASLTLLSVVTTARYEMGLWSQKRA